MDRNSVIGTLLIGLLFILFIFYTKSKQEDLTQNQPKQTTTEQLPDSEKSREATTEDVTTKEETLQISAVTSNSSDTSSTSKLQEAINKYDVFYTAVSGEEKFYTIENEKLILTLSNKGGRIIKAELKDYLTWNQTPLILFDQESADLGYNLFIRNNKAIWTGDFFFEAVGNSFKVEKKDSNSISFRLSAGEGKYIEQKYVLHGNKYMLDYKLKFVNMSEIIPNDNPYINLNWTEKLIKQERDIANERRYSSVYYRYKNSDVEHLNLNKPDDVKFDTPVDWVSFKQQFFNFTIISAGGFNYGTLASDYVEEDTSHVKDYTAKLNIPYRENADKVFAFNYFIGPNHYSTLKKYKMELEEIIQLSADFALFKWFGVITKWIIIPVFNFLERFIPSYGIIILILTLLLKTILFPLTFKSYKSAAAMRVLKPELDELKEKFKNDQQKLGTEQMKLYSKAGVNPLGGCLPMLFQMPILIAMYYFFPSSIELRQEHFLWAQDLSTYDSILSLPFTIPIYGSHVSLFTLLMTVSSVLYSVTQTQMAPPGNESMKYMPYIFPFFLMFIFNSWPAGLTYYYFLSNMITFGQQYIATKFFIDEDKLHKKIQENKAKPKKKSKFAQRLESIAKQQEELKKGKGGSKSKKK